MVILHPAKRGTVLVSDFGVNQALSGAVCG